MIKTNRTCEESIYNFDNPKPTNMTKDDYIASLENRLEHLEGCKKETLQPLLKKIENLHIALKKKKDKNKNQALEITNLLEQKKDLQEINDTQNEYIKELENKVTKLQSNLDYRNEASKQLINDKDNLKNKIVLLEQQVKNQMINAKEILKQLEEKDIIISYLRSELK